MWSHFGRFIALSGTITAAVLVAQTRSPTGERSASAGLFEQRVAAYVSMRDRIARDMHHAYGAGSSDETFRRAVRESVRAARSTAKAGDILAPMVAPEIVRLVRADLVNREPLDRDAIIADVPQVSLRVNDEYPAGAPFATTPPRLLLQLPQLGSGLQYRFVGRALILLDADTDLVVDVIQDALPPNR